MKNSKKAVTLMSQIGGDDDCPFTNFAATDVDMSLKNWSVGKTLKRAKFNAPNVAAEKCEGVSLFSQPA